MHGSGTTPQSQRRDAVVSSIWAGQCARPEMRSCISLLGLNNTKKDAQEVSSKCNHFILASRAALPQILLDLPMFSWYVLHFSQIISAFHLYLAREQGRGNLPQPWLTNHTKRTQWSCEHDLKPKITYCVISLQNKLFMILYETPTPLSMKKECCIYEATLMRGSIILVPYTWTMLKIYYFVIREEL